MTELEQIRALASQGVGRLNAEAMIGRHMTPDELMEFRKAATIRTLKIAQKKAAGPKSVAERVRKHVASGNEISGFSVKPRHPRLKESCRYDLARFGWYYCRRVLKHKPSEDLREGLIKNTQDTILGGGQVVEEDGRGTGKTTWIAVIAPIWATFYGHRRYPLLISATAKQGKKNLRTVKRLIARSKGLQQDFPAIVIPIQAIGGISQRAAAQRYNGVPTDIEWGADQITLPMCRDMSGKPLDRGCGAIIASIGIGGAVRGSNEDGQRPDFLIFDDPQTKKIAHSPKLVQDVITYIHQDALQLGGHDRVMSAFVTITPQCYGDVATELTSQTKHPEWSVFIRPFVKVKCANFRELAAEFCQEYADDQANHDTRFTRSREWYRSNRELFAEMRVVDPLQFDPSLEEDAIHHVLNLRAKLGEESFNAEIMMSVADLDSEISIDPDTVAKAVNGAPRCVCPPGTDSVVGFVDVNIRKGKGLSWGLVAFGPGRVAACIAYGRYPERGPVCPPNVSDLARNRAVAKAIRIVVAKITNLRIRDSKNRTVPIRAVGFDRGYLPGVVHRALYVLRKTAPVPFPLVAVRGFPWNKFGIRKKDMLRRGDHIFATRSQYGEYLAEMAPYWREIMQSGFLETPLMPGSFSLYGSNPAEHFLVANEICNEKLIRKYVVERAGGKTETAWDWIVKGDEHFCDVFTGCFAVASWFRCYDALSVSIDAVAAGYTVTPGGMIARKVQPKVVHQDDLFDPRRNAAVGEVYDGVADETEGVGEAVELPDYERENLSDPLVDADPRPKQPRKIHLVHKTVHKFRKGRWKR
jgi:hypothetical protein